MDYLESNIVVEPGQTRQIVVLDDSEHHQADEEFCDIVVKENACLELYRIQNFMRTAVNSKREYQGLPALSTIDFMKKMKEKQAMVEITEKLQNRFVNVGYSGGEKKKNEIFQMAMLEPSLAILDETDSGLDIDALRIVANGVNQLHNKDNAFVVITHYQRLLDYIVPDFVHVMYDGRIVKSGGKHLAIELEEKGYEWIKEMNL